MEFMVTITHPSTGDRAIQLCFVSQMYSHHRAEPATLTHLTQQFRGVMLLAKPNNRDFKKWKFIFFSVKDMHC